MKEYSMYFAKPEFYELIRNIGGTWNDSKERPIVCLLKLDDSNIYWAIPVGNWKHRDNNAKTRINSYIQRNNRDLQSCFYHVGNTTVRSIFFISDVIPITDKYISSEYKGYDNNLYTIKNEKLKNELIRKLKRILRHENLNPNYFRQHITAIKNALINEEKTKNIKEKCGISEC